MSSNRKRAAIRKAEEKADSINQRLILANFHSNVYKNLAMALAKRVEELEEKVKGLKHD